MICLDDAKLLPEQPGIYIFKEHDTPIYIGKSVNIKLRVKSHIHQASLSRKEHAIVSQAHSIDYTTTLSNFDALLLEAKLIQHHKPKYNVVWKDDKSYLYIKLNRKAHYPIFTPVRKENDGESLYFGPFRSSRMTEALLLELRRIIPFCTHTKVGSRPCFYAKLGYCNPCPYTIESEKDPAMQKNLYNKYLLNVKRASLVLSGKTESFAHGLQSQLKRLSDEQRYEEAIGIRSKLFQFSLLLDSRRLDAAGHTTDFSIDELENQLRTFMQKTFAHELGSTYRIECYDISNLFGKAATGSMVVFQDGLFARKEYRRFKVQHTGISDIHMMEEVLSRRFAHTDWRQPDLIILDGGKPQLRHIAALCATQHISTCLISLAKRPDRILVPETLRPIPIDRHSLMFRLFQSLRDESHRFAKKYHTTLRNRNFLQ